MPKWHILGWYICHPSPFGEVTKPPRYHLAYLENEHDNNRVIEEIKWVNVCNMLRRTLWVRWSCYLHIQCMLNCFSHVQLFVTPWTVACQALCPWDFLGKNIGVGCCTFSGGSNPGIKPISFTSPAFAGWFFTTSSLGSPHIQKRTWKSLPAYMGQIWN